MYPQKSSMILVVFDAITYMIPVCYLQRLRRRLSCFEKSVFNVQEGHVLECRRASSCLILGPLSKEEGYY